VPANIVPVLLILPLNVPILIEDAESAVSEPELVIRWPLFAPDIVIVVPLSVIVAALELLILALCPVNEKVEPWSVNVPVLLKELPEVVRLNLQVACVVNELELDMVLPFPKLKAVFVALIVPELLKNAAAPLRLIVAELVVKTPAPEF